MTLQGKIARLWASIRSRDYSKVETRAVRVVVPIALVASLVIAAFLSVPSQLPGPALGSRWVLYGLWVLGIFYGFLLLFLPLVRSLKGQLPIELSLRGPRYEEVGRTADAVKELRSDLQSQKALVTQLTQALQDAGGRILALEEAREAADGAEGSRGRKG